MNSKPTLADAIISLIPNTSFSIVENDIIWIEPSSSPISRDEIDLELKKLEDEYNKNEYQRLRSLSYPSIYDYLDGVVKNDHKYPKNSKNLLL
jgi:hypothetical protein